MSYFLIALGIWLYPIPALFQRRFVDQFLMGHVHSLHKVKVDFSILIRDVGVSCAIIHAALKSGNPLITSYDQAMSIHSPTYRELINRLLRPNQPGTTNADRQQLSNCFSPQWTVKQQKLLDSSQTQLHIFYELALMRGANMQNSIMSIADRMHEELLNNRLIAIEKSAVKLAGPLTLCFLPAFIFVGLVPTVISLAHNFFSGMN